MCSIFPENLPNYSCGEYAFFLSYFLTVLEIYGINFISSCIFKCTKNLNDNYLKLFHASNLTHIFLFAHVSYQTKEKLKTEEIFFANYNFYAKHFTLSHPSSAQHMFKQIAIIKMQTRKREKKLHREKCS